LRSAAAMPWGDAREWLHIGASRFRPHVFDSRRYSLRKHGAARGFPARQLGPSARFDPRRRDPMPAHSVIECDERRSGIHALEISNASFEVGMIRRCAEIALGFIPRSQPVQELPSQASGFRYHCGLARQSSGSHGDRASKSDTKAKPAGCKAAASASTGRCGASAIDKREAGLRRRSALGERPRNLFDVCSNAERLSEISLINCYHEMYKVLFDTTCATSISINCRPCRK
jgi:hypothetical protein